MKEHDDKRKGLQSQGKGIIVTFLVVYSKLLGFNLILRKDIIRKLDGVQITSSGKAVFSRRTLPICAALKIDEPDFSANFYKNIVCNLEMDKYDEKYDA